MEGDVPEDVVTAILRRCIEWTWPPDEVEDFLRSLDKDDQPTAYLFRRRVCATHLAHADFT
ncbi:CbrC family protein [Streptomyces sviceus]|uniref:CbrC family protein n=1 Tax=Streptomyces sviceus TaxID=285530 RepID=UPI00380F646D